MKHFPDCAQVLNAEKDAQALKKFDADVNAYAEKWPKHCRKCGGWGGRDSQYDPSPAGVGMSIGWFHEFDPCRDCYELEQCPRCAKKLLFVERDCCDYAECKDCGWQDMETEGSPSEPPTISECECWGRIYEQEYKDSMRGETWS